MAHNLLTFTLKLERASKRKNNETCECHSQCKTRSKLATSMAPPKTCFISDTLEGNVSKSSTIQSDNREWEIAARLLNQGFFAKWAMGEMAALDARYYKQCLTALANTYTNPKSEFIIEQAIGVIMMCELIIYLIWERDQTDTDVNSTIIKERLKKMCQT